MPWTPEQRAATRRQRIRNRRCRQCAAPAAPMVTLCPRDLAAERKRDADRRAARLS